MTVQKQPVVAPTNMLNDVRVSHRSLVRKSLFAVAVIVVLSLITYSFLLWFSPPPRRSLELAAGSQSGPVVSTKAISQLPDQKILQPVIDTVDGLTVDVDSDNMRAISEINYRDGMEEQLQRIEDAYADGPNKAPLSRSATRSLEE
jgi:hypothetical protein